MTVDAPDNVLMWLQLGGKLAQLIQDCFKVDQISEGTPSETLVQHLNNAMSKRASM